MATDNLPHPLILDLTGHRYGGLQVLEFVKSTRRTGAIWKCRCLYCGKLCEKSAKNMRNGNVNSCGHCESYPESDMPLVSRWRDMLKRCRRHDRAHKLYFDKGIKVCERWKQFKLFKDDMGESFRSELSLDRIDNSKGYYKENCRWTTAKQQARNTDQNRLIAFIGKTQSMAAWAEEFNIPYKRLHRRLKLNWCVTRAILLPHQRKNRNQP